ncbi:MAG: hypothetical protein E6Q97_18670 [Desulfurellales bacterium]|nr:MAG: hypothetical protein E6Q97_18670 [Desulfurellales bacterium]
MRVVVSDHAVVRYLERVMGFDFAPIRDEILAKVNEGALAGARRINVDGFTYQLTKDEQKIVVATVHASEGYYPKKVGKGESRKGPRPDWATPLRERRAIAHRKNGGGR